MTADVLQFRTDDHLPDLRVRLAREADSAGLVDAVYTVLDTRIGSLLLAATRRGLVRVSFESEGFDDVLRALADRLGPRVVESHERLAEARTQLLEYLDGRRRGFDLSLDRRLSSGFRLRVQERLPRIAYGTTRSYGALAAEVGAPGAARAVGTACATNPLPIVVPCHRVLRGDGSLGHYLGGTATKAALLAIEGAA